jgi:hypothetical protein
MTQEKDNYAFISDKRRCFPVANYWSYSDVALFRHSFGILLVLLRLSYGALKWISSAILDEPSGKAEREKGSKIMRRYTLLGNTCPLAHEAGLVVQRTYVREAMNIVCVMKLGYLLN